MVGPRVNFLLDIIFECLLLSRNYESRLGTGIKSWKSPVPACKDLKTPWRTAVGWQILLAVCKDHGWYGLGLNEQTRERRGKQGQEKLLSKMTLKLGFERWGIDWVPSRETWVSYIADRFFTIWATREAPKIWNPSQICMSSLCRGHANLLYIVQVLLYVLPKRALNWLRLSSLLNVDNFICPSIVWSKMKCF